MNESIFNRTRRACEALIKLKEVVCYSDEATYFESDVIMIDKLAFKLALSEVIQSNYMVLNDIQLRPQHKNEISTFLRTLLLVSPVELSESEKKKLRKSCV